MTQTTVAEIPVPLADSSPDLEHLICCNEDVAMCGADVSDSGWGPGWENVQQQDKCLVCLDLDEFACSVCGL